MTMPMSSTDEAPNQKTKTRKDEDATNDVPLLCVELTLKLKSNKRNNRAQPMLAHLHA